MADDVGGELVETAEGWSVPMVGTVTQCRFDFALTLLVLDERRRTFEARIEQPFELERGGPAVRLDPEGDAERMAPALGLLRREVERTTAFRDGRLELAFADRSTLRVAAHEAYEAWTIVGAGGLRIVSLPGGQLAVWPPVADGRR